MRLYEDHPSVGLRIHLFMAFPVSTAWLDLARSKSDECRPFLPRDNGGISTAKDFFDAVESLAIKAKARKRAGVLNGIQRIHMKVRNFADAAVRPFANELKSTDLLGPVWNIMFALVESGLTRDMKLGDIAEYLTKLDEQIPAVDACETALAHVPDLHKPLQNIYARHIDSYLEVIALLHNSRPPSIKSCLEKSQSEFKKNQDHYAMLRRFATQVIRVPGVQETAPSDFEFIENEAIGSPSTFAKVYAVREKTTGLVYAMKKIPSSPSASSLTSPEAVINEINIMRKLSHHHIATLAFASKDSHGFVLYIMPRAECDLGQFLDLKHKFTQAQVWKWFGCLVAALNYAHRNSVKHKDIKPENVLIDEGGKRVLLTDFGLSRDFSNEDSSASSGGNPAGTDIYFAPECIAGGERTSAVDVFALGCVFAEMVGALGGHTREDFRRQRQDLGGEQFRKCLGKIKKDWLPAQKRNVPQDEQDRPLLILETKSMLAEDAEDRPDTSRLLLSLKGPKLRCHYCSS